MVESRRWAIKKFLRGYAVTFTTAIVLILVLALLLFARIGALGSIRDLSRINPLITSEQNQLVAIGDDGEVTIISDDEQENKQGDKSADKSSATDESQTNKTSDKPKTSAGGGSTGSAGGSGTGGESGGASPGGGTNNGGTPVQLVANIASLSYSTKSLGQLLGCSYTAKASIQVNTQGTVYYQWIVGSETRAQRSLVFADGEMQREISEPVKVGSVKLVIVSPGSSERTISVASGCLL